MSRKSQEPSLETDMKATATESRSPLGPLPGEHRLSLSKAARLQAIRELVQSDGYHIPAMLVAERMIERAVTEDHDHKD